MAGEQRCDSIHRRMYVNKHSVWDLEAVRMAHKDLGLVQACMNAFIIAILQLLLVQMHPVDLGVIMSHSEP